MDKSGRKKEPTREDMRLIGWEEKRILIYRMKQKRGKGEKKTDRKRGERELDYIVFHRRKRRGATNYSHPPGAKGKKKKKKGIFSETAPYSVRTAKRKRARFITLKGGRKRGKYHKVFVIAYPISRERRGLALAQHVAKAGGPREPRWRRQEKKWFGGERRQKGEPSNKDVFGDGEKKEGMAPWEEEKKEGEDARAWWSEKENLLFCAGKEKEERTTGEEKAGVMREGGVG